MFQKVKAFKGSSNWLVCKRNKIVFWVWWDKNFYARWGLKLNSCRGKGGQRIEHWKWGESQCFETHLNLKIDFVVNEQWFLLRDHHYLQWQRTITSFCQKTYLKLLMASWSISLLFLYTLNMWTMWLCLDCSVRYIVLIIDNKQSTTFGRCRLSHPKRKNVW